PECPRCGVIYAKAHRPAVAEAAPAELLPAAVESPEWSEGQDDLRLEARLRAVALPAALGIAWLLVKTGTGRFFARVFFGMWVHEIGHALAAWLCGFPAFPGPWITPMAAQRSPLFAVVISAALGWGIYRHAQAQRRWLAVCAGALLALQLA